MSKIQWTNKTWNPVAGCNLVSPGCTNCYAIQMAHRLWSMGQTKYHGLTQRVNGRIVWTGKIHLDDEALQIPLRRRKPTMYFVNSMSDLFHEDVPDEFVDKVFAVMAATPQHTFQILTKRPACMAVYVNSMSGNHEGRIRTSGAPAMIPFETDIPWPLPNVWMGASVENQGCRSRIDDLRAVGAVIRFLSLEPLLEDLGQIDLTGIDWVIVGGESGQHARPCNVEWVRSIVQQCRTARVPVFVKQLGSKPESIADHISHRGSQLKKPNGFYCYLRDPKGGDMNEFPQDLQVRDMPEVAR